MTISKEKTIHDIANEHWNWVEQMGWHNKTPLESMALVVSEIGEALEESRGSDEFAVEVADIFLRLLDMLRSDRKNVANAIYTAAMTAGLEVDDDTPLTIGRLTKVIPEELRVDNPRNGADQQFLEIVKTCSKGINRCRQEKPDWWFAVHIATAILQVIMLADTCNVDLAKAIEHKMARNIKYGSRGRAK